ncbi:MAG: DUF4199 domain-containing protein [Bacteroidales bacterium]|nr:DUF4199 domain-containing protein [Bacteroidales bacterium]
MMEENQNFQPEVEQPQPVNKLNSAATNGLKLALISIGFTLIASFIPKSSTGVMFTFLLSILKLGATVTFLWWAMKTFSAKNAAVQGFTTYGNVFSYGLLTSLFSGIVLAAFSFVNIKLINPEAVEQMKEAISASMDNIEGFNSSFLEVYYNNFEFWTVISTVIGAVIYGLIFSAIIASSTKKNPDMMSGFNNF